MRTTRSALVVVVLVMAGLAACGSESDSLEAFCEQAVPILSRSDLGDDPEAMRAQMADLERAARLLPDQESETLRSLIAQVLDQVDAAVSGEAGGGGWSNAEVVESVGDTCDSDDLLIWFVQP